VELQLLREVAGRSDSFFQAAASLQHLLGMLGDSVGSIRGLRRCLAESDEQMYSTAVAVKGLQARRSNLQATLDITKVGREVLRYWGVEVCIQCAATAAAAATCRPHWTSPRWLDGDFCSRQLEHE
jgi:hypothetical protein